MTRLGMIRTIFRARFSRNWTKQTITNRPLFELKIHLARPERRFLSCRSLPVSKFSKQTCLDNFQVILRGYSTVASRKKMPEKKKFERLPKSVIPTNYKLRLHPDLTAFTFAGSEEIEVEVKNAVSTIRLNSVEIAIQKAVYKPENGTELKGEVSFDEEEELAILSFPSELQLGKGVLQLEFTGELNDKMKGFYRSKYTTPAGEQRFAAVTQFEATDARRAFPCWDEPAVKATFDVTLVGPKDRVILSNMPVVTETTLESDSSQKVMTFQRTPIMSTYLLAFVVGEFDYVEDKDSDDILIRVYTPTGKKEQGKYALDVAVKTLPFYKDYFGIVYPLPKMDLIAIGDFSAGAMENWGLVTYRETALLVDPKDTSTRVKLWVALVVGHELAHQWFGNLVTMEWWTHLWLNEGFASWIEYLCVDHCFPEFDVWTQFVNTDLGRALELDALHNSHPIEVEVGKPAEVDEIFDAISYSKGASVIRMLHDYIGDKDFRKGMNGYLTKHKFSNTVTEDLWQSLEEASDKPVRKMMDTWTSQKGFPVIKVSQKHEGTTRTLTVEQEKFCADGKQAGEGSLWLVPISVSTGSSPDKPVSTILLDKSSTTITLDDIKPDEWVKVNTGTVGVYRVQYSSDMLGMLVPAIKDKSLPPKDRLGLLNDLYALARAGCYSAVDVLKVTEAFVNEDNYTVWSDLSGGLASVAVLLQYTDVYPEYKTYACKLYSTIAASVGWDPKEDDGPLTPMLRDLVLTRMGRYNDEATVEAAKKRFQDHFSGVKTLPADLRLPVYVTVLTNGNEEVFNQMLELYEKADMQEEKVRISRSLGLTDKKELIQRVLDFAISDKVRSQDTVFVIVGATGSVLGREMVWEFVKENWKKLHERYEGGFLLSRLVKYSTENFVTEEKAKEVQEFFKANPAPAAERTVEQSVENIRLNVSWMEREAAQVTAYLKSKA
ncbi:puromycin-sensitive aminopeptidase-like isoform X2 [Babylonia areolata]|uniref:puromycin-sensitive aminopeptidase-like isoform X2 n=1 Tax=Babylonia areolata TaxID=304850 RepID=UPI003FD537BB